MRRKIKIILLLCFIQVIAAWAQDSQLSKQNKLDSIKRLLTSAKLDSIRLNLLVSFGEIADIKRVPFWDSIYSEANNKNLGLYKGIALFKIGLIHYRELSNVDKADTLLTESYRLIVEDGNKLWTIKALSGLTGINMSKNRLTRALEYGFKGLRLSEEYGDNGLIGLFNLRLGTIYFFTKNSKNALKYHLNALSVFKKQKNYKAITDVLCDISSDYQQLNDTLNFFLYSVKSADYVSFLGETKEAVLVYNTLGVAYYTKKRFDSAEYFLKKALNVSGKLNSDLLKASSLTLLANNYYLAGNNIAAKEKALIALELCRKSDFTLQLPTLAELLKKIHLKDKNYKEALEAYELYISSRDSISNEENRKSGAQKEFDYQFEKKENENKLLAQQNKIQGLELRQNNYFIWGMGALLLLMCFIGYLSFRQNGIKAEQQRSQLEQKLLRSQMNPHFIFNSLQAIQNFILKHDEKEAVKYLSSFASITRNVLENSRMEAITLKKEITLLENYLQLQRMRFKGRFEYQIKVDEMIDTENTMVPPMLSQPFIENAVEHGFHDIESEGKITVHYHLKKGNLIMEITDNGIGMKDNYTQNKNHQSLALEITKERVALMNKKLNEKVIFTIAEAFPLEKVRKGVRVGFSIPLNFQA